MTYLQRLAEARQTQKTAGTPFPAIHSSHAMFCLDCQNVFIATAKRNNDCYVCGGGNVRALTAWLEEIDMEESAKLVKP